MRGKSLSCCVRDIAAGEVNEADVEKIVASTHIESAADMRTVLRDYRKGYWFQFPRRAMAIAIRLFRAGKVEQPRVEGGSTQYIGDGHWEE